MLYIFYMPAGQKISKHIYEFNKIVLDLANIKVKFEDEDLALLLLTSLLASYKHFVDTLLYGREDLTLEDVMATLNLKEIKERSKAKGDDGKGLYVRGRTHHRDSRQSRGKSRSKSRGGRLKFYICQSEDHLKRNCPKNNHKKSTCYVKKDEKPSSSGSIYDDSEVMMVMNAHAQTLLDWIMDLGYSYHMTPKLDILFDFLECDRGSVELGDNGEFIPELKRNLISLGTLEKEGYTVKLQSGKVKVINGSKNELGKRMNRTLMDKVEGKLQRLNNHTSEEDQTDQEDDVDKDAGDQETDQPPDLTDYQLVRDREPRTRTKPLRFRDEMNMAAYAFVAAEEEDTHEPLTYQKAVACEHSSK
nr:retrovirus-related Pol polyprotein from transposon TNT 1-94 [Tanacetum cinerariifolium]